MNYFLAVFMVLVAIIALAASIRTSYHLSLLLISQKDFFVYTVAL